MAAVSTIIAGAGLALSAGSAIGGFMSGNDAREAQQKQNQLNAQMEIAKAEAQEKTNALRQQQMNLDATRRKREILRSSLAARSAALATTTNQGAGGPGGSQLGGAYGSIMGRTGVNTGGIVENQMIGNKIFGINQGLLETYKAGAAQGAQFSGELADAQSNQAMFQGIGTIGNSIASNAGTFGKVATFADSQINGSMGVGTFSSGGNDGAAPSFG